jgi:hypothetical protein
MFSIFDAVELWLWAAEMETPAAFLGRGREKSL